MGNPRTRLPPVSKGSSTRQPNSSWARTTIINCFRLKIKRSLSISMRSLSLAKKAARPQSYWRISKGAIPWRRTTILLMHSTSTEPGSISWLTSACSRRSSRSRLSITLPKIASCQFKEGRVWCSSQDPGIRAKAASIPWWEKYSSLFRPKPLCSTRGACFIQMK